MTSALSSHHNNGGRKTLRSLKTRTINTIRDRQKTDLQKSTPFQTQTGSLKEQKAKTAHFRDLYQTRSLTRSASSFKKQYLEVTGNTMGPSRGWSVTDANELRTIPLDNSCEECRPQPEKFVARKILQSLQEEVETPSEDESERRVTKDLMALLKTPVPFNHKFSAGISRKQSQIYQLHPFSSQNDTRRSSKSSTYRFKANDHSESGDDVSNIVERSSFKGHRLKRQTTEMVMFLVPMHGGIWTLCVDLSGELC